MKPLLIFHIFQRDFAGVKPGRWKLETTGYSGDGHVDRNDTLVMSRFKGGYFDYDGKPHYYLTDWQGNNVGVFDKTGKMEQQVNYYPSGEPWLEPEYAKEGGFNRYLFGGKERIVAGGINEYDFLARTYVASQCRFTTLDPLAEKTPWLSPYAYCAGNPVNFIDPDGRHTRVMDIGNGMYEIIGGEIDDDLNIYEYYQDANGKYTIRGESIGVTTSITSFYKSDAKNDEKKWPTDAVINTTDMSGIKFLKMIFGNTPTLDDYIANARNGHLYDFKATNYQQEFVGEDAGLNYYRGMPVGINGSGQMVYTSARDIGNIAAGYVAGVHGLSWATARLGFDGYQSYREGKLMTEGASTQNAEFLGWKIGYYTVDPFTKQYNIERTKASLWINSFKILWNKLFK